MFKKIINLILNINKLLKVKYINLIFKDIFDNGVS